MPTLNWIGKEAVVNHHQQVPFHLLKDVPELACGEPGDGNLIVQGDNLVALKALLPYYAGQVKCIYIDPPYNTGNEGWAYNDNVNSPVIREWLGKVVGKEGETLDRHDRWLCMMYPRLVLLKQFLREDGAIFVSIDDNEVASLRLLIDEVFGAGNFAATFIWEKRTTRENRRVFSFSHDYIICYARNLPAFEMTRGELPLSQEVKDRHKNPDGDPRGAWQSVAVTAQAGHGTASQFIK
jgi:adenine-specific DNA-methyltransferase